MKAHLRSLLVLGLVAGLSTATVNQAQADHRGRGVAAGVAAGIIGLGLLGAYASRPAYGYSPACYRGPERCGYAGRSCWENRYGETVCRGGEWRCWRPTVCD